MPSLDHCAPTFEGGADHPPAEANHDCFGEDRSREIYNSPLCRLAEIFLQAEGWAKKRNVFDQAGSFIRARLPLAFECYQLLKSLPPAKQQAVFANADFAALRKRAVSLEKLECNCVALVLQPRDATERARCSEWATVLRHAEKEQIDTASFSAWLGQQTPAKLKVFFRQKKRRMKYNSGKTSGKSLSDLGVSLSIILTSMEEGCRSAARVRSLIVGIEVELALRGRVSMRDERQTTGAKT